MQDGYNVFADRARPGYFAFVRGKGYAMKCVVFIAEYASHLLRFAGTDVKALQTLGAEIHFFCPLETSFVPEEALDPFNSAYPKIHWHDVSLPRAPLAARKDREAYEHLKETLREISPSLIHCFGASAAHFGRKAVRELKLPPVLYTTLDFPLYDGCNLLSRAYHTQIEHKYAPETATYVPTSEADRDFLERRFPDTARVELPFARLPGSCFAQTDKEAARTALGLPQEALVLVSIGDLLPKKRQRVVLQAMTRLRDLDVHYLLCGDGPDRVFLEELTKRLRLGEKVHFLGYRADAAAVLAGADIFCDMSRSACGCAAALEAMAAGLPVVGVQSHEMRKVSTESELGAKFLEGDLVESAAAAIKSLADKNTREKWGAANRDFAETFRETDYYTQVRKMYAGFLPNDAE